MVAYGQDEGVVRGLSGSTCNVTTSSLLLLSKTIALFFLFFGGLHKGRKKKKKKGMHPWLVSDDQNKTVNEIWGGGLVNTYYCCAQVF